MIREKLRSLYSDNLFRNSFYLMLNTAVQAVLGFFFWLISARLFTPEEIGVAASLISAMTLISYLSLLGFNTTFIRILPTSKNRDNEINTGLLLSILAAIAIGIAYVLVVPYIAPRLSIVHENIYYAIVFVALVALAAINLLTDSIFVAFRAAKYNLLIDGGIMGIIKMLLPFAFVGLGAYGAFAASGSAAAVAMVASIIFLVKRFDYKPRLNINKQTLRNVFHYSTSNYIANLLNITPILVLPLIVIDHLGAAQAGYYYLAFTVANLLYAVVYAVSQSLLAEGSYGDIELRELAKRSAFIIMAIMIPAGALLAVFGPFVLQLFGKSYSTGGANAITIFALAAPAVVAYTLGGVLLRITNKIYAIISMNVVYAVVICGLATVWVDRGLIWVAIAWLVGNLAAGAVAFAFLFYSRHSRALSSPINEPLPTAKRAIIMCDLDGYANSVKPPYLKLFLEKHGYSVDLYSTVHLSRLGIKGFRRLVPYPKLRHLKLYFLESLHVLARKQRSQVFKKFVLSFVLQPIIETRGRILQDTLMTSKLDLLICENNFDEAVVGKRVAKIQILDLPAPFAEEMFYGNYLTEKRFIKLKELEKKIYGEADYLSFHWHTYAEFVKQEKYNGDNFIDLGYGTFPKTLKARFAPRPKIIFLGSLTGYWVNLPLLERLSKSYPIDVYGGPRIPGLKVNYKGYALTIDMLADYQFGLVTVTEDPLRQHSFSSKQIEYFSYGLPVLVPEWREDASLASGSIPYNPSNFLALIHAYSDQKKWEEKQDAALAIANKLHWETVFEPLISIIKEKRNEH